MHQVHLKNTSSHRSNNRITHSQVCWSRTHICELLSAQCLKIWLKCITKWWESFLNLLLKHTHLQCLAKVFLLFHILSSYNDTFQFVLLEFYLKDQEKKYTWLYSENQNWSFKWLKMPIPLLCVCLSHKILITYSDISAWNVLSCGKLQSVNTNTHPIRLPTCCSYKVKDHLVSFLTWKSKRQCPDTNRHTQMHKSFCRSKKNNSLTSSSSFLQRTISLNTLTSRFTISYQFTLSKINRLT